MFKIICVGWKAEQYIDKCIHSLLDQTIKDWECCIALDPSGDKTYEKACKYKSDKIKVLINKEKRYAIGNISYAVKMLNCIDDDILVWLDADDWFSTNKALEIVKGYYDKKPELLVTHGSWQPCPKGSANTNNAPYTRHDFIKGIRDLSMGAWRGSHLRTMKYKVYKHIDQDREFKWSDGRWLESSYDLSLMYPALEMAGFNRVQFIPEILYIYNRETRYNDDKINGRLQSECAERLIRLPRYKELNI